MKHKMESIESFSRMIKDKRVQYNKKMYYVLKPKLHGTNASIRITSDGEFECRSKNRILSPTEDHMDFMKTMLANEEYWQRFFRKEATDELVIYGEWAGPGIQKSDAVSMIPMKTFFVFSILNHNGMYAHNIGLEEHERIKEIPHVWYDVLELEETADLTPFVNTVNKLVEEFETCDPYIKSIYGIDGTGEGVVGCPIWSPTRQHFFDYTFKAKTEAHRVKKTKAPATVSEPVHESAYELADAYVTIPRFKQAMSELQIDTPDMTHTGSVLKWMHNDIVKESMKELKEMNIDYSNIQKVITRKLVDTWKEIVNNGT